jgi:hypothetical protein
MQQRRQQAINTLLKDAKVVKGSWFITLWPVKPPSELTPSSWTV